MSQPEIVIPTDIQNYTKEKKMDIARQLIKGTVMDSSEIAALCHLGTKSVARIRSHINGDLPDPPHGQTSIEPSEEKGDGKALNEEDEPEGDTGDELPPGTPDLERPTPPTLPVTAAEKRKVHQESAVLDINAKVDGLASQVQSLSRLIMRSNGVSSTPTMTANSLSSSGGLTITPLGRSDGIQETYTTFESYREPIYIDNLRRATFEQWKAVRNEEARENGTSPYTKDIGGMMLDAFDEFFERRHVDLEYSERHPGVRPNGQVRRVG